MKVHTSYNEIAGRNLERLTALSDGVFAIAMTLLVLDLKVPASLFIHSDHDLWQELISLSPKLITYLMSFLTLGIFWVGHQTGVHQYTRGNRHLTWLTLSFLCAVTFVPFTTALLAEHINLRGALLIYWFNLVLLGNLLLASWIYAHRAGLMKEENCDEIFYVVKRRILMGQGLYAFGALLCIFNPYFSIGFIVLVQLNFALAPKLKGVWRI